MRGGRAAMARENLARENVCAGAGTAEDAHEVGRDRFGRFSREALVSQGQIHKCPRDYARRANGFLGKIHAMLLAVPV